MTSSTNLAGLITVARWSRHTSTDERVEKAPFTDILAIVNVVERIGLETLAIISLTKLQYPIFLAIKGVKLKRHFGGLVSVKNIARIDFGPDHLATLGLMPVIGPLIAFCPMQSHFLV
jgi:hypothetical protein